MPKNQEKYSLYLEVPGLPKTPNARMHWKAKMREVQKWRRLVASLAHYKRPQEPLERAKLTFVRHSSARPDFDNLAASFKACQDGLKQAEIIADDTFEVIGVPTYQWEKASPRDGKIEIFVEAL